MARAVGEQHVGGLGPPESPARVVGAAVGAFVGGGTYALIRSVGASAPTALGWSFGLLTAVAIAALLLSGRISAQVQ